MRTVFLAALVLGLGWAAWAQVSDTMTVTVTINPAYADALDVPTSLSIEVARLDEAVSAAQTLTYTTDYTGRDITVVVQSVSDPIPVGFKLYIGKDTDNNNEPDTWVEIDLQPDYEARILFQDVDPGQEKSLSFWIKADATGVSSGDVGKQFMITLKFTLASL